MKRIAFRNGRPFAYRNDPETPGGSEAPGFSLPKDLDYYDWIKESLAFLNHPIPVRGTRKELLDHDTGEVLARAADGYEFYWAHGHPHITKETK